MTVALPNTFQAATHNTLYEQDYALWLEQAVDLLRSQNFAEIDIAVLKSAVSNSKKVSRETKQQGITKST